MISTYVAKLDFITWKTSVGVQKIDSLLLETYGMASARFPIQDSLGRVWFFDKTFLLANTHIKVVLRMPFLFFNNANVSCAELEKLT